jgi:hypothetical protein
MSTAPNDDIYEVAGAALNDCLRQGIAQSVRDTSIAKDGVQA